MISYIKAHKGLSTVMATIAALVTYMAIAGTLAYPYIMIDRQLQLLRLCTFGSNIFTADTYGFLFTVPSDYCLLPHRIFPEDGSIQVLPKDFYFVINEYAVGSVTNAARATILFEKDPTRTRASVVDALNRGGFLKDAIVSTSTNKYGVEITLVRNALGVDATKHYDWAFVQHQNGVLLSVITQFPKQPDTFNQVLDGIMFTK